MNADSTGQSKRGLKASREDSRSHPPKRVAIASRCLDFDSERRATGVQVRCNLLTLANVADADADLDADSTTVQAAEVALNRRDDMHAPTADPSLRVGPSHMFGALSPPSPREDEIVEAGPRRLFSVGPSMNGLDVEQEPLATDRSAPYRRPHWWVDVYDVLTYGKWSFGIPWAIGGDYLAPKPVIDNGRPPVMNDSDDEEDRRGRWFDNDVYVAAIDSYERVGRRIQRRDWARYLERVVFSLIDLRMEHFEHDEVCLPDGFIVKRELPAWKKLIDEYRRFPRELTDAEKKYEDEHDEIVLMEPPLRQPLEGEYALWGEAADHPPNAFGVEVPRTPRTFPFVVDPFPSEDEEDNDEDDDDEEFIGLHTGRGRAGPSSRVAGGHEGWF